MHLITLWPTIDHFGTLLAITQPQIVFKNKKKLKGSGIVISELLTSKRSALFKRCLERIPGDRNTRSIWTDNCKILVKFGRDSTLQIKSEEDINKLIRDKFPQHASPMEN